MYGMGILLWQYDVTELMEGDIISREHAKRLLASLTKAINNSRHLVSLCKQIEKALRKGRQGPDVQDTQGAIHVLTQRQAATYGTRSVRLGWRKARRYHKKMPVGRYFIIYDSERVEFNEQLAKQSRMLAAINSIKQPIELEPVMKRCYHLAGSLQVAIERSTKSAPSASTIPL